MNAKEEVDRLRHYATVPKKHYEQLSGKKRKVLAELAIRFGIPIAGRTVDLNQVLRWFHGFLIAHGREMAENSGDIDAKSAKQQYDIERAKLARMTRLERENGLVARDVAHAAWQAVAARLQQVGTTLETEFGAEALKILNDGLKDCSREVDSVCAPIASDNSDDGG